MVKVKGDVIPENESAAELRYLVAHKKKGVFLSGTFEIVKTLAIAQSATGKGPEKKKQNSRSNAVEGRRPTAFGAIQEEITSAVARHRALDRVMSMLTQAGLDMQFAISVDREIKKFGDLLLDDSERKIYSFHKSREPEVFDRIKGLGPTAEGIHQLPNLLIIGLVSEYDVFLQKLIRIAISHQENAAMKIDKSLSLKELFGFSTIEEAKNHLIEKEVDSILHDDHREQLLSVNRLFNLKIDVEDDCVKRFLELCERRNLFTHNAGIVNARYLAKSQEFKIDVGDVKIGDELRVNQTYFRNAISTIHELSIKTTQFLWRKLVPSEHNDADSKLNEAAFQLLKSGDYKLAERILHYGLNHTGPGKDDVRRMMVINHANAIKLGGDGERANKELGKHDWSATEAVYRLSVAAVKNEMPEILKLLPSVAKSDIDITDIREWPVFKLAREDRSFQEKVKLVFGEDIISSKPISTPQAISELPSGPKPPAKPRRKLIAASKTKH